MDDFNFMQYIRPQMAMFGRFPRPPNRPHFVLPPPIQPPRERHFNAMHDGVNFGFNNGPQGFNLNVNFEPHRYRHVEAVLPQQQLAQRQADQGIVRAVDDVRNRHVREEENLERQLQILRRTEADVRRNFEQLQAFAGQRRDPGLRPRRYRMIEDDEQRQERERRRRERMQNVGRLVPNEDGVGRNIDQIGENLYNRARDADLVVPRPLRERHVTFAEPQIAPNQREYRQPPHRERHVALAGVTDASTATNCS
uniref:Uncharacterized protein n=1 Tax=Panagrolaimus davidi TaxID=227884 RepID=A0A914QPH5_9BILA